eukprot:9561773-Karenia_brevis.AAC.1
MNIKNVTQQLQDLRRSTGQPRARREWGIRLPDQSWQEGPGGLMNLGDMLRLAGYEVTRTGRDPPPPPPGPIPPDY